MSNAAALPALSLLAGIVAGVFLPAIDPGSAGAVLIAAWAAAVGAHLRGVERAVKPAAAVAFAVCGALLSARALDAALHTPLERVLDEAHALDDTRDAPLVLLEGRLRSDAAPGPSGVRLSLSVSRVTIDGHAVDASGGVLLGVSGALAQTAFGEWTAGRMVRVPVLVRRPARYLDPGVADQEVALARRGTAVVGTAKSAALVELVSRGRFWDEWAAAARAWTRRRVAEHVGRWSPRSAAIVTALLIGDRAGLDDEVERRLQEAGTYHVIAISGGNIALLAGAMAGVLALLRIADRRALVAPIAALLAYAFLVGGGASVVRATAMAVVYLAARVADHRSPPLNVLGVAAAAILCVTPLAIFDAGFALTFGATLAILAGVVLLRGRLPPRGWRRAAAALLLASVCAEIALFPVSAFVFSRVTFAGLLLNFAAVPLMSLAQLAGLLTLAAATLSWHAAQAAGLVAHLGAEGLVESARLVDYAPWLTYRTPPPSVAAVIIYYSALIGCVLVRERGRVRAALAALTAGAALWILAAPPTLIRAPWTGTLEATFFDVGQGDAALVRFPNGRTLLIDTGGVSPAGGFDIGARVLAPALWASGLRRLTYLAITHGDPDHIGGAQSVVRDFTPAELWYGVPVPPHEATNALSSVARTTGSAWRTLWRDDEVEVGGVRLRVLHPPRPDWERQQVRNDDSIVMELTFGDVSMVFSGDIGREIEQEIAPMLAPAKRRVLKVAHHGSATSSSQEFLDAVKPSIAVISCGRGNRYGHPVPSVLERLTKAGADIFRTDQDGAIVMKTDGQGIEVLTYTGRRTRRP